MTPLSYPLPCPAWVIRAVCTIFSFTIEYMNVVWLVQYLEAPSHTAVSSLVLLRASAGMRGADTRIRADYKAQKPLMLQMHCQMAAECSQADCAGPVQQTIGDWVYSLSCQGSQPFITISGSIVGELYGYCQNGSQVDHRMYLSSA